MGAFQRRYAAFTAEVPSWSGYDRTTPPPFTLCLYTIFQRKVRQSTSLQVRREFLSPCSHIRDTGPPKGPTGERSAFSLFRERYGTSCHSGFKEDRAIHRSIACYVDKAYRQKATAATCYIRQEGIFLPSFDTSLQPTFKKSFDDKQLYILCDTEKLTSDPAFLRSYISSLIKEVASV